MDDPNAVLKALDMQVIFAIGMYVLAFPCVPYLARGQASPLMYILGVLFAPLTLTWAAWRWLTTARY